MPVIATKSGAPYNPTGDVVQFAFMNTVTQRPQLSDWQTGIWEVIPGPQYLASILVNGSGVPLPAALYYVWVKITDSPEAPVRQVGTLSLE